MASFIDISITKLFEFTEAYIFPHLHSPVSVKMSFDKNLAKVGFGNLGLESNIFPSPSIT